MFTKLIVNSPCHTWLPRNNNSNSYPDTNFAKQLGRDQNKGHLLSSTLEKVKTEM